MAETRETVHVLPPHNHYESECGPFCPRRLATPAPAAAPAATDGEQKPMPSQGLGGEPSWPEGVPATDCAGARARIDALRWEQACGVLLPAPASSATTGGTPDVSAEEVLSQIEMLLARWSDDRDYLLTAFINDLRALLRRARGQKS